MRLGSLGVRCVRTAGLQDGLGRPLNGAQKGFVLSLLTNGDILFRILCCLKLQKRFVMFCSVIRALTDLDIRNDAAHGDGLANLVCF